MGDDVRMREAEETRARRAASEQWQRNPAGTTDVDALSGTPAFFHQMRASRYRQQPWLPRAIERANLTGRVLEIGCGAGQDNQQLGRTASVTVGIDLAHEGARLTDALRRLDGRSGGAMVADGERMPFPDGSFDGVYSFGVIHHTDHPERLIAEIHRVLRPGGRFLVGVYHRWSWFAAMKVYTWLRSGRKQSWADHLAGLEKGAEELDERPVVRLYSRRQARDLFVDFKVTSVMAQHYGVDNEPLFGKVPESWRWWMARLGGWYVLVSGRRATRDSSSRSG